MRTYTKFIVLEDSILVFLPKSVNATPISFLIFFSRYLYGNSEINLGGREKKTKLEDTYYMISKLSIKLQS